MIMKFPKSGYAVFVISLLLGIVASNCTRRPEEKKSPAQTTHDRETQDLATKRKATDASLRAMSVQDLVTHMELDAQSGREPFNSPAYREMTKNRKDQGAALMQAVRPLARPSFITLLAIRSIDPTAYASLEPVLRRDILLGQLAKSKSYNVWGMPHLYWEDAANAVVELGEGAVPPLKAFLADRSPAPVWGSEEYQEYQKYKYRRCDYALALILAIRGQDLKALPVDPSERDRLIEQVQKQ
jgi:hypothetical protein